MCKEDKDLGCGFYVLLLGSDEVVASGDLIGSFFQYAERSCIRDKPRLPVAHLKGYLLNAYSAKHCIHQGPGAVWLTSPCLLGSYILIHRDMLLGGGEAKWEVR